MKSLHAVQQGHTAMLFSRARFRSSGLRLLIVRIFHNSVILSLIRAAEIPVIAFQNGVGFVVGGKASACDGIAEAVISADEIRGHGFSGRLDDPLLRQPPGAGGPERRPGCSWVQDFAAPPASDNPGILRRGVGLWQPPRIFFVLVVSLPCARLNVRRPQKWLRSPRADLQPSMWLTPGSWRCWEG